MKKYYNPEMAVTKFDKESVAVTASAALAKWGVEPSSASRNTNTVKFSEMKIINGTF